MTAAQTALAAGDYAAALGKAIAAQGYLAATPDSTGPGGTGGGTSMRWDAEKIEQFISNIRRQQGATGTAAGIQRSKIVHARTSASA